jgi:hypothetical protein
MCVRTSKCPHLPTHAHKHTHTHTYREIIRYVSRVPRLRVLLDLGRPLENARDPNSSLIEARLTLPQPVGRCECAEGLSVSPLRVRPVVRGVPANIGVDSHLSTLEYRGSFTPINTRVMIDTTLHEAV